MAEGYVNFDLYLRWQSQGISVECDCPAIGEFPPLKVRSRPKPLSISSPTENDLFEDLRDEGKAIAEVLLPRGKIRWLFRKWWNAGIKIRLRLIYPHQDFAGEDQIDFWKEQIKEIAKHHWEYIYLSKKKESDPPSPKYFLSLREEISIAHYLQNSEANHQRAVAVNTLPARILYFPLFDMPNGEILTEFKQQIGNLKEIVEHQPLSGQPEAFDVEMGFQDDHVVHITCHGNENVLNLEPDPLTPFEAMKPFEHTRQPQVKAIILLSCDGGSGTLATWLHLHAGVPVVIGMTGTIYLPSAKNFVGGFYYGLKRPNEGLERAVFLGRYSMFNQGNFRWDEPLLETNWRRSFGLPRLFLNGLDSVLIPKGLLFGSLETMVKDFDNKIREVGNSNNNDTIEIASNTEEHLPTLQAWIKNETKAWYLITGPAGTDKTTLIERLLYPFVAEAEKNPFKEPKIIYHFCQMNDAKTSDPMDFIVHSLVPQLVKHYDEAYKQAISPGEFPLLEKNELRALEKFVIKPLTELVKTFPRPVIIIDRLHVVDPNYSILDLLIDNQGYLEDVARFIVTADSDDPDYPSTNLDEPELVEIEGDPEIAKNVLERIYRLTNRRDGKADLIFETPDGPPLALFVDMMKRFTEAKEDLTALLGGPLPEKIDSWQELYNFFGRVIKAKKEKHGDRVTDLLSVVTVAYEPFRMSQVAAILKTDNNELRPLFDLLQLFFEDYTGDDPKLILYHDRIKKHLLQERDWWHGRNLNDAHKDIVEAFRPTSGNWADVTNWETLTGTNWSAKEDDQKSLTRYVRRYLVHHAYYSCYYTSWKDLPERRRRAKAFLNLICDPGFRNARLKEVGQRAGVQDIWLGLRVINAEYIHASKGKNHTKTRVAFDRLLAAQQSNSYLRNILIWLEQELRNGPDSSSQPEEGETRKDLKTRLQALLSNPDSRWKVLFEFLGLDTAWWHESPQ